MSDFKAKMHQIDFGWGSTPSWRSIQHAPDSLAGFKGPGLLLRDRREGMANGRGRRKRQGRGPQGLVQLGWHPHVPEIHEECSASGRHSPPRIRAISHWRECSHRSREYSRTLAVKTTCSLTHASKLAKKWTFDWNLIGNRLHFTDFAPCAFTVDDVISR